MAWSPSRASRLSTRERKWLAMYVSTANLRKLCFSQDQINWICSFRTLEETAIRPLFTKGMPFLHNHPELIGGPESVTGITYEMWREMAVLETPIGALYNFNIEFPAVFEPSAGILLNGVNINPFDQNPFNPAPVPNMAYMDDALNSLDDSLDSGSNHQTDENNSEVSDPNVDNPNNAHDLTVKYADCYGIRRGEVIRLREFSGVSDSKTKAHYQRISSDGYKSDVDSALFDSTFDFTLPKLGFINFRDHVIQVIRQQKRSSPSRYRKGLRSDTVRFTNISSRELSFLNDEDVCIRNEDSFGKLFRVLSNSIFFPEQLSYAEALEAVLNSKRLAASFSSSLAIKIDSLSNKIVLQKNSWIIGNWNSTYSRWDMADNTFNEDLISLNIRIKEAS
jgi:hypothetical protein